MQGCGPGRRRFLVACWEGETGVCIVPRASKRQKSKKSMYGVQQRRLQAVRRDAGSGTRSTAKPRPRGPLHDVRFRPLDPCSRWWCRGGNE